MKMTHYLELNFTKPNKQFPSTAAAQISVKSLAKNEAGDILITPYCTTIDELSAQINILKRELDNIQKKAKVKFEN